MKNVSHQFSLCIVLLAAALLVSSCDYEISITIENKSERNILFCKGFTGLGILSPDTLLPASIENGSVIRKDQTTAQILSHGDGGSIRKFYKRVAPCDTLYYFFIDQDSILKYGWDDIRSNYKILVRYDLSVEDLFDLRRTLSYPPSPAMRYMKMYPPYEQVIRNEEEANE